MQESETSSQAAASSGIATIEWLQSFELGYSMGPSEESTSGVSRDGGSGDHTVHVDGDTVAGQDRGPDIAENDHERDQVQQNANGEDSSRPIFCFHCGSRPIKVLKCAKCKVASYCQKDCQVQDWKKGGHKFACTAYKRIGPNMQFRSEDDRNQARSEIFTRIRYYVCPYSVHKSTTLGNGFLFIQSNTSLALCSLPKPKDSYGRIMTQPSQRSLLIHYLTLGEYDSEVCRDDFELAVVRTKLHEAVLERYNEQKEIVVLMRFRCGSLSLGITPLVPEYAVCKKLGIDYFANSTAGALQLNLDDM